MHSYSNLMIFQAVLHRGTSKADNKIRRAAVEKPSGYTSAFITVLPHSVQAFPVPLLTVRIQLGPHLF